MQKMRLFRTTTIDTVQSKPKRKNLERIFTNEMLLDWLSKNPLPPHQNSILHSLQNGRLVYSPRQVRTILGLPREWKPMLEYYTPTDLYKVAILFSSARCVSFRKYFNCGVF